MAILTAAILGRALSKRLKQTWILGELILGMVLGSSMGLPGAGSISDIGDIGLLLLLFSAGLSLDLDALKRMSLASGIVAALGVAFPLALGYAIAVLSGFPHSAALVAGAALVATSVGVSVSILAEYKMIDTKVGTLIIGAAVIDDVIGIMVLIALHGLLMEGTLDLRNMLSPIISAALLYGISLTALVKLGRRISKMVDLGGEDLLLMGFLVMLAFATLSEGIGLSTVIGAFVGGLVAGRTHFRRRLSDFFELIGNGFFIPIFFVTMGMKFNAAAFLSAGILVVWITIAAALGKVIGCGLGAKATGFGNRESLAVGIAMIPRAEVALVVIKIGLDGGFMDAHLASVLLATIALSVLMTPPLLSRSLKALGAKG
ncbi:MAG: cation:proton antiporter [Candidatus Bathyarchaeia archaeon]